MNRYEILHTLTLEQLAKVLGEYKLCNICKYQSDNKCLSISHKESNCYEGIKLFLKEEF